MSCFNIFFFIKRCSVFYKFVSDDWFSSQRFYVSFSQSCYACVVWGIFTVVKCFGTTGMFSVMSDSSSSFSK